MAGKLRGLERTCLSVMGEVAGLHVIWLALGITELVRYDLQVDNRYKHN